MDQPQTILVGTDFSDISDEALRAAALYAKTFNARVLVTHVFDPTPNVPPVGIACLALAHRFRTIWWIWIGSTSTEPVASSSRASIAIVDGRVERINLRTCPTT